VANLQKDGATKSSAFVFRLFLKMKEKKGKSKKKNPKPTDIHTQQRYYKIHNGFVGASTYVPKESLFKSSSPPPPFGFFLVDKYSAVWVFESID
jgi:hypothetical protein